MGRWARRGHRTLAASAVALVATVGVSGLLVAGLPVVTTPAALAAEPVVEPAGAPTVTASSGSGAASLLTAPVARPDDASGTTGQQLAEAVEHAEAEERRAASGAATAAAASAAATARAGQAEAAATAAEQNAAKAAANAGKKKTKRLRAKVRRIRAVTARNAAAAAHEARREASAQRNAAQVAEAAARTAGSAAAAAKVRADAARVALAAAAQPSAWRAETWRSAGEARGARLGLAWSGPVAVSRLRIAGSPAADRFGTGVVSFSDGSSLQVTADSNGDVDVSFPRRTVTAASLVVEAGGSSSSVSLSAMRLDDGGNQETGPATPRLTATSGAAEAALDGDLAHARFGQTWTAGQVASASLTTSWSRPRELASFQVVGIQQNAVDAWATSTEPVRGEVVFSDGSSVPIAGISGGAAEPTVVAFTPRVVTSATLTLTRVATKAVLGAREIAFYDVGQTPARVESQGGGYTSDRTVESCDPVARASVQTRVLLCPLTGTSVGGPFTVAVRATAGTLVTARADVPGSGIRVVGSAQADSAGVASVPVDASQLYRGPLNVGLVAGSNPSTRPFVYAQVVNESGVAPPQQSPGRAGMTLQFADEFTNPLSVSTWGRGATYAAVKPEYWGEGAFSDAVFAKPESGAGTLATRAGNLRIRVKGIGADRDPNGWGRKHYGGMMSSMRVGGSGFAAQHGYFEARILGAPGKGTWPAFWMMDTGGATQQGVGAAETDAVELYGHSTLGSCHTIHTWVAKPTGSGACPDPNGFGDWALAWHTYGVQVVPNGADFYIDGRLVTSRRGQDFTDRPMFFMLNLALGGGWPVGLAGTDNTADMWVDWVRVYT